MFTSRFPTLTVPLLLGVACCVLALHCGDMFGETEVESHAHAPSTTAGFPETGWRRTIEGWEQVGSWKTSSDGQQHAQATRIHPGLVAALILLVSLAALLAFDPVVESCRRKSNAEAQRLLLKRWARRLRRRAESHPVPPDSL